jgi:hypothetical protein
MNSGLRKDFNSILKPKLIEEGFRRIDLDGCIKDEELWRKGRLWFGCSFDWRDQYFETDLGHLYWFRDVMPRVVILGRYSSYASFDPTKRFHEIGLIPTLEEIRDSLGDALIKYEENYNDILRNHLQPKKGKYVKEFFAAFGEEVKDVELQKFIS